MSEELSETAARLAVASEGVTEDGGQQAAEDSPKGEGTANETGEPVRGPSESPLPLLGGRALVGIALLGLIALTNFPLLNNLMARTFMPAPTKERATWEVGKEADLEVTLITADKNRLNCAHDAVIEGYHCDYTENRRLWPRRLSDPLDDDREKVIQPYRTADTNDLVLVAGLWAQPELAMRLHREPPSTTPERKQIRFVAYCRVKFIGELKDAALRWERRGKWYDKQTALVAKPLHCTLEEPKSE